jgi:hypothetical protein
MPDNSRFVFWPGNQWTDDDTAPYFVVPSAWRRFIFQVLSPRELAIYLYVCSLTDRNAIAYPTIQQMVADLGVKSRLTITPALDRLVRLGFLLGKKQERGFLRGRMIYQRPAPHYTLIQLLDVKTEPKAQLDGELYPIEAKRTEHTANADKAVETHLKRLLGDLYVAYQYAPAEKKREVLAATLYRRLATLSVQATNVAGAIPRIDKEQLDKLPPEIQKMIDVDHLFNGTEEGLTRLLFGDVDPAAPSKTGSDAAKIRKARKTAKKAS